MTICLVHLVTDRDAGDPARAELVARVLMGLPGAVVHVTSVPPRDTLATGFCVGQLVLCEPRPPRIVAHDVAAGPGDPGPWPSGARERLCIGRSVTGTLVVGPNVGWSWSFAVDELRGLCALDVSTRGRHPDRERLPTAIAHARAGHPHAVRDPLLRSQVPRLPGDAVAFVDGRGNLKTTIPALPEAAGERVRVRIGDVAADATVTDGSVAVGDGELALAPASSEWPAADDRPAGYLELHMPGGSAAERFDMPRPGTPIELTSRA
jgi:hypothetical protein